MNFHIKQIILWPRNEAFAPRKLTFQRGSVNVISGNSRTGKSAIIPIIDYCLGADKCTIPVKTVRDACSWFGVVVETDFGEKLFARREPGDQKTTGDMYVVEGKSVDIPITAPSKNTTVDIVKRSLDELAGLTALDFDVDGTGSGFQGRPSFRDLAAFMFQPQNVVANPDILFYKADTYEHREKIRTIFPYVLNAVTPETLAKQHELLLLQRELRRKQGELGTIQEVSERWIAEIQANATEAKELGLVDDIDISALNKEGLVDLLRRVVDTPKDDAAASEHTINDAVQELIGLQREESSISLGLSGLRKRLVEMTALRESTSQYHSALQIQRDRLAIADWLHKITDLEQRCPLCNSPLEASTEQLASLYEALHDIEQAAGDFSSVPAAFDREYERVKTDVRNAVEHLGAARIRREALERTSQSARQYQYDSLKVSRFVGNVEQALEMYRRIGTDSELESEVSKLAERVTSLDQQIAQADIKAAIRRALGTVNLLAGRFMPHLDAERPNDPITLSINDLTITVGGAKREDYLWEIGSGSNWLSYHIAVSLALQQYFLSLPNSPVPSFIVYDQPSQVYFPRRLAGEGLDSEQDVQLRDEDIVAVQKAFRTLANAVQESGSRLQVIVLDHASEDTWGEIEGLTLIEDWRLGRKLVPIEWTVP